MSPSLPLVCLGSAVSSPVWSGSKPQPPTVLTLFEYYCKTNILLPYSCVASLGAPRNSGPRFVETLEPLVLSLCLSLCYSFIVIDVIKNVKYGILTIKVVFS